MEIKVRALDADEQKSTAEIEQALLEKHEEQFDTGGTKGETTTIEVKTPVEKEETIEASQTEQQSGLEEKDVLSYIEKRYGKEISSIDELIEKRETSGDMPEDVATFLKYKKDTGRSLEDFVKLNKDYSEVSPDKILADYYLATEEGLDAEDVEAMMADFTYDEELDVESDIKKKKLAKKRAVSKAKKYFEEQKSQYSIPLESSGKASDVNSEEYQQWKEHLKNSESYQEEAKRKSDWFRKKTDEVFNEGFKGFEFELGDKKVTYAPGDAKELRAAQSDVSNFINKFINNDGLLDNAQEYHKSLSMAMNPHKFAKFFYEQGKADAIEHDARTTKNIDMDVRKAPQRTTRGGLTIKAVSSSSNNNGLRIRSNKR